MTSFYGKSVLVLGGSRGIGAAIVRRFASDGAKVVFSYLSSPDEAQVLAAETGSEALRVDSADRDALIALIASLGPLDVLVVNSGILGAGDPLNMPPDDIDRLFRINIHAPYHAAVAAARTMPDGGRIIFIGSANADRMPMAGLAAYSASKSALKGMTKGLARDFGARGITVNVIQPGPTDTDMNPAGGPLKDVMHGFMAIKRHAKGEEIAGLVAYLAGPEAGIITGAAYNIDGGFTA
ncbi:SDR family oxidoreductase [Gluconobacter frateurii]|uniref:Oxidoreductase n=1 Tax=Gluconobacter frateurii NRIC 0228 TaxID=1307946 RepID=A0ABQ0Q982_9PROT|nr:SDR family oxidoreductase [Gluconobacter frateurii]GBR09712.1 oxidoreductase [Gluconobacter frateurii NRIC 0228]GLP91868.1 oxidoreductase [Gluconobacter frateurii]